MSAQTDLVEINVEIGHAEARGDHDFFESLLAPAFAMVRPDGLRFDDRSSFLAALASGPRRRTRVESVLTYDDRAIVTSAVAKGEGEEVMVHRNIRVFSRSAPDVAWKLVAWVTEPLSTLES